MEEKIFREERKLGEVRRAYAFGEYAVGTARTSPESLSSNDTQVLARDKPWLYSAIREGFPCKHLS